MEKVIYKALYEAHNELSRKMLKKLKNFKSSGNPEVDNNNLIEQILCPIIQRAREKILHKLICDYPLAVEKRLKVDGFGVENPNNKKYLENLGGIKNEQ